MFDSSWSELAIVEIVGVLIIGPEELPTLIKNCRKTIRRIKAMGSEFTRSFDEISELEDLKKTASDINKDLKTITDLNGNEQPTFDISELLPPSNSTEKSATEDKK